MQLDAQGNFVASPVLVEAPSLTNGGLTQNPFTVRFQISPAATWDDGSPITSEDFAFTWRAVVNTMVHGRPAAYRYEAYQRIVDVDTSDQTTAVVRLDSDYADWPDLFGGGFDYILKADAFPDADREAPNLGREMMSTIPFAAGPFKLESWGPDRAVLIRNPSYFGPKPLLDRVTFVWLSYRDPFLALREGDFSAVVPEVWSQEPGDHPESLPGIRILGGDSTQVEALWMNFRTRPLDDPKVREALMYAIDRQALIDTLVKEWNPGAEVVNCGLVAAPGIGPWCDTEPFARFSYDPSRSRAILESDGYDCAATFCTKDGKVLAIEYYVHENSARRKLAQSLVLQSARAAGFSIEPRTYGNVFCCDVTKFPMFDAALEAGADPSVTDLLSCGEIRSSDNPGGGNFVGWCDQRAEALMLQADRELDPSRRLALMQEVYQLEAEDFVSLPLFAVPTVAAWRPDQIAGPIGLWNSSPYGLFFNMEEWWVP
jgi:glutathione transport system substrate-binding protein